MDTEEFLDIVNDEDLCHASATEIAMLDPLDLSLLPALEMFDDELLRGGEKVEPELDQSRTQRLVSSQSHYGV